MSEILHMDTDAVRQHIQQVLQFAEGCRNEVQGLTGCVRSMDWNGPSRSSFVGQFEQCASSLDSRLDDVVRLMGRLATEVQQWEAMAGVIGAGAAAASLPTAAGIPTWLVNDLGLTSTWGPWIYAASSSLLFASSISAGATFFNQINIARPGWVPSDAWDWLKSNVLDMDTHLTTINADNLAQDMADGAADVTPAVVVLAGIQLVSDWVTDYNKYKDDGTPKLQSAFVVDAGLVGLDVAASAGGSYVGTLAGGAIGTMICPVVGTVIGGFIGGAIGGAAAGWATDYVMTTPIQQMLPNVGSFLGSAVMNEFGPLGTIAGPRLGSMAGGALANLITGPVCTKVSIKDYAVDGLTPVMQSFDNWGNNAAQQLSSTVSTGYQSASSAIDNFLSNTSAAIQNAPVPSFSVF